MASKPGQRIRLGGLVKEASLVRGEGTEISFVVTDGGADVSVYYSGILPDLFREGQGVVTEGAMKPDGSFKSRHGSGQTRRNLHAQRGCRCLERTRPLAGTRRGQTQLIWDDRKEIKTYRAVVRSTVPTRACKLRQMERRSTGPEGSFVSNGETA